jgi:mono/diheme cytochrome c family protein
MPEALLPFGPFHMLLLHLPIGALCAIWFVEILLENEGDKHKNLTIGLLHVLLLLSTLLTITLGMAYAELGDYGDEIEAHAWWGYLFGGGVLITHICYWINYKTGQIGTRVLYILSLLATTVALLITGHQGGELIHGKGFLTKAFKPDTAHDHTHAAAVPSSTIVSERTAQPEATLTATAMAPIEPIMGAMDPMMDAMDPMTGSMPPAIHPPIASNLGQASDPRIALFENAQAIFNRHCTQCHGPTKQKGNYRLDQQHTINLGGKSKRPAIVTGKPDQSELLHRMLLPRSDDEVMPPIEKAPVSAADIDLIRQWIAAGAYWPDATELRNAKPVYVKVGDVQTDQLIAQLNRTGAKAEYNAWGDNSVRVDLGVVDAGQLPEALQQLQQFGHTLSWIDASNLELPHEFYPLLLSFPRLERLHLDGSSVTDDDLAVLQKLPELNYLNLYNSQISDTGLQHLQACRKPKRLYLTNTQVTSDGIQALQQALPELKIVHR